MTRAARAVGAVLAAVLVTVLSFVAPSHAAPSTAPLAADSACAEGGVTVVVDFTDLGGEVEVGCALEATTGTEALQSAGFTDTRDGSGLICAIDAQPDPCPAEFTGSFWSYWHGSDEWVSSMEGSDTTTVDSAVVEGWRYHDGSAGPTITPAEAVAQASAAEDTPAEATDDTGTDATGADATGTDDAAGAGDAAADGQATGPSTAVVIGIALLVVIAVAAFIANRRRSAAGDADD